MQAGVPAPAFVLAHSPLLGPRSWAPVARELERRGRQAVVPSLLGLADAPEPRWRHVPDAVRVATEGLSDPVVLAGHSGAGLLLPAIAEELGAEVSALIFVDSFLPSSSGSAPLAPPSLIDELRSLATAGVLPPWSSWFGEGAMRELVPDQRLRRALEQEMPRLPLSYLEASVPLPDGWDERPCAFLLLSEGPYREAAVEARRREWPLAEIPAARHLGTATEPAVVTETLLSLERALLGSA